MHLGYPQDKEGPARDSNLQSSFPQAKNTYTVLCGRIGNLGSSIPPYKQNVPLPQKKLAWKGLKHTAQHCTGNVAKPVSSSHQESQGYSQVPNHQSSTLFIHIYLGGRGGRPPYTQKTQVFPSIFFHFFETWSCCLVQVGLELIM